LETESEAAGKRSLLLLPDPLQIGGDEKSDDLKRRLYGRICSYFIENEANLRRRLDLQFNLNPLRQWLENPIFNQANVSVAGFGAGGGQAPNAARGFDQHGFFNIVDNLLGRAFSDGGGMICVLDNLEILNTSRAARMLLEQMRDDVLARHGLKWVVCGARGIVKSVASSARLQGRLQEPIEVAPLAPESIREMIEARVRLYAERDGAIPPVGARSFEHLFKILNQNLRDSFKFSADFAAWLYENEQTHFRSADDVHALFEVWLAEQSEGYHAAIQLPPRAWKLFDDICNLGGSISPSDNEAFGFNSPQAMRGQIAPLENNDLIVSEIDETDHRRKTISVTAKGWFVRYHRTGYQQGS
jgi:hypothetical protein